MLQIQFVRKSEAILITSFSGRCKVAALEPLYDASVKMLVSHRSHVRTQDFVSCAK